jgi:hypothetical protein
MPVAAWRKRIGALNYVGCSNRNVAAIFHSPELLAQMIFAVQLACLRATQF